MQSNICKICKNDNLVSLIHLGKQALTGVFPKSKEDKITSGPLELVKCHPKNEMDKVCHLVQLLHSYDSSEMYGINYGYRSGLNQSMVKHLHSIVQKILSVVTLKKDDLIIDIGSNDSTLLQGYPANQELQLIGIDPTGIKFIKYYPKHIQLISDFFSVTAVNKIFPDKKAKVVTSIAMFYDLENPVDFVKQIYDVLADDGVWVFEQSYLPSMLNTNSYDTICHEHLEYYALSQIKWMMDEVGFKIVDVELNNINGGSFRVVVAKKESYHTPKLIVEELFEKEKIILLDTIQPYDNFAKNVYRHKKELCELINKINQSGKNIFGYGASTKGNVMLQYCGFSPLDIPYIAEVNEEKFGSFTPFTHIPIISEKKARAMKPNYFLVLPWHFKKSIIEKEQAFLQSGGKFIFPLPKIEIIGK